MENRIPLPTDNIYKFYALFGLLLAIFCIGASIYLNKSTNDALFQIAVEYDTLEANPVRSRSQEARYQIIRKQIEIAKNNKQFYLIGLSILLASGIWMIWHGFRKWHTEIQPNQDEITRLSIKKLKQEVGEDDHA